MSPYLGDILSLITKAEPDDNEQVSKSSTRKQIRSKIALISQTVSTSVTPRVLLPALDACFDEVAQSDKVNTFSLPSVLLKIIYSHLLVTLDTESIFFRTVILG